MQKESVILQNRGSLPILPQMQEDCHSLQIYLYNISIANIILIDLGTLLFTY